MVLSFEQICHMFALLLNSGFHFHLPFPCQIACLSALCMRFWTHWVSIDLWNQISYLQTDRNRLQLPFFMTSLTRRGSSLQTIPGPNQSIWKVALSRLLLSKRCNHSKMTQDSIAHTWRRPRAQGCQAVFVLPILSSNRWWIAQSLSS